MHGHESEYKTEKNSMVGYAVWEVLLNLVLPSDFRYSIVNKSYRDLQIIINRNLQNSAVVVEDAEALNLSNGNTKVYDTLVPACDILKVCQETRPWLVECHKKRSTTRWISTHNAFE